MNLPRALSPWTEQLDIFPVELAGAMGPLIQRLAAAIGPLRARHRPGTGDPDGFHGISRRGVYERLLISEWLLAEEIPLEFSRRAAMGEHLFLEMERKEPHADRRSVALFDAGPDQLGWSRIAHVAILIVLARRAQAAGARFQWGVLQSDKQVLYTGVDEAGVRDLLRARTAFEPSATAMCNWREELATEGPVDDRWMVGGRRCAALAEPGSASLLQIGELIEIGERRVVVAVCPRGNREREIVLEMPREDVCVRLIRDPFANIAARQSHGAARASEGLVFTSTGSKLLARGKSGTILSFTIPNSPNALDSRPKAYHGRDGRSVIAAGRAQKSIAVATGDASRGIITLHFFGGKRRNDPPQVFELKGEAADVTFSGEGRLGTCFHTSTNWNGDPEWVLLVNEVLLTLARTSAGSGQPDQVGVESRSAMAVARTANGVAYLALRTESYLLATFGDDGQRRAHKGFYQLTDAFFGYGGDRAHPWYGFLAYRTVGEEWRILDAEKTHQFTEPAGRVVGATVWEQDIRRAPALVVVDPDGKTLSLFGQGWERRLFVSDSQITEVVVNPSAPQIALTTVAGEVIVYSLPLGRPVLRYQGGRT